MSGDLSVRLTHHDPGSNASGDVLPVSIDFDPLSRRNNNPWSDRQSDPLWLLTPDEFTRVPDYTELVCISGRKVVKGRDPIDLDTRGGFIAFGLLESQVADGGAQ